MLTDLEKEKIRLEETYRNEVKGLLQKKGNKKSFLDKIISFLNTSLGLWLLSAIFVSGGVKLYEDYKANSDDIKKTNEAIAKLDLEISYRYSRLLVNLYELTDKNPDTVKLSKSYNVDDVKKVALSLRNSNNTMGDYFYPEYSNLSLLALLAEEKRYLSHLNKDKGDLNQVISDITGLEVFYEVQKADFSDVRKIAISIEDKLILDRWKDNGFYFLDGNDYNPFP